MTELSPTAIFREARDLLLRLRADYAAAKAEFRWPELDEFNWALDWFDVLAAEHPDRPALRVVNEDSDTALSYAELSARSNQVANWMRGLGVSRGDRVLLMLGNIVPLWEVILASIKLSAVIIPASTLLGPDDLADRIDRGDVRHVVTEGGLTPRFAGLAGDWTRIAVGGAAADGWSPYSEAYGMHKDFTPDGLTRASDPLLLYFTSGTTSQPKLVEHTHASYPAGHLSTLYWIGLQPGDVHLNVSSPGWAKHAWSNVFAPLTAGATAFILGHERFSAAALLDAIGSCGITSLCAPPTVWRMLVQADLASADIRTLRECVGAGEPLNPEVIEQVRRAWQITVRDGYGQTETTAQIGNSPGQPVKAGSMGRALPGYDITLVEPVTGQPGEEGEICLDLSGRPLGLMTGYRGDPERAAEAMRGGYYHTGDVASRDADGYITYIGRTDDVFKASDYRISPFELESVLIEHAAVAEAAVVPSPDPLRLAVPKAYVVLAAGWAPDAGTAEDILRYARERLAPFQRIRRLEFADLPKTISGKIRRVELRAQENDRHGPAAEAGQARAGQAGAGQDTGGRTRAEAEFWEEDFPGLRAVFPDKSD
jgi:acetyl-CoA synthetase